MNVVVIGSGYVGLVTGCCLAEAGNNVVCVDHDVKKVNALTGGTLPFYEPELEAILDEQIQGGRLTFTTSIRHAMGKANVVFLAVGTPPNSDGSANLHNLLDCAKTLGQAIPDDCVVVVKSTVPVGTCERIRRILNNATEIGRHTQRISIASNPEFLAEGRAVQDFRDPDRIVIGADDPHAFSVLSDLYAPFNLDGNRLILMDIRSAEFAKYACNSMLAARISMINELSGLAGALSADINAICRVLKGDARIGGSYLHPGVGYGGSCLPKDLSALIDLAQTVDEPADMLRSIQKVNLDQRERLFHAIRTHFNDKLRGKTIGVWGLSFKPGTDDVRAAPSLSLISSLVQAGAIVRAYDPVAEHAAQKALGDMQVHYSPCAMDVCANADALAVMTEWEEFGHPDFKEVAHQMRGNMIFDARGLYQSETLQRYGLEHYVLGQNKFGRVKMNVAQNNQRTWKQWFARQEGGEAAHSNLRKIVP
ncbi:hypothetical protein W822_05795 [Advenella kashmirensis W13003]|uniref:UDP-glucose 6-dehydrogenase n=2 Tax=Advenella kashmirensis TaxID=310575 RepID=V8QWD1_9BURK|nr:hypothetical protein W822_05795 [Advenella kashmirensis W13003]